MIEVILGMALSYILRTSPKVSLTFHRSVMANPLFFILCSI